VLVEVELNVPPHVTAPVTEILDDVVRVPPLLTINVDENVLELEPVIVSEPLQDTAPVIFTSGNDTIAPLPTVRVPPTAALNLVVAENEEVNPDPYGLLIAMLLKLLPLELDSVIEPLHVNVPALVIVPEVPVERVP
jgi:hypothetical protein